ncbi:citrate lyase holo-[acyl-carrier protein] synthase [Lactobacillus sp. ESL0684]|uniref:citrate lyase holo-[acyl-carrier protein] synthase n=1 Tax=Lactobacillus sp. ESL0684 TaxID=2983213 RepID=UPI0023F9A6AC|nr:citrate lyase holo-[acyl-carrier protein] synthase [Lactobacillus sp. ESL0684]WEV44427.1 citrate lyase holo-[acyl-carrier protein] synthase [Lactobacillus sp. ESL0684]
MTKSIFKEGQPQDIVQVLADKDRRVRLQTKLLQAASAKTLLDVKLNIPGPIKNNQYLRKLFVAGVKDLERILTNNHLQCSLKASWDRPTGCENFYLSNNEAFKVKQAAIYFEDQTELGRLFDADVLTSASKAALSRTEMGLKARSCFLCQRPAKECARSRRHSVNQLQAYLSQVYENNLT